MPQIHFGYREQDTRTLSIDPSNRVACADALTTLSLIGPYVLFVDWGDIRDGGRVSFRLVLTPRGEDFRHGFRELAPRRYFATGVIGALGNVAAVGESTGKSEFLDTGEDVLPATGGFALDLAYASRILEVCLFAPTEATVQFKWAAGTPVIPEHSDC